MIYHYDGPEASLTRLLNSRNNCYVAIGLPTVTYRDRQRLVDDIISILRDPRFIAHMDAQPHT